MDYGSSLHGQLRAEAGPAWTAYVEHAFVRGLEDSTLPRASFLHYLQQDYV
jgi:thiaminase/transcriptional activator TenA